MDPNNTTEQTAPETAQEAPKLSAKPVEVGDIVQLKTVWEGHVQATVSAVRPGGMIDLIAIVGGHETVIHSAPHDPSGKLHDSWR